MTSDATNSLLAEVMHRNERSFATNTAEDSSIASIIGCLTASARNVFTKMCGVELTLVESNDLGCAAHPFDASGIIGVSGAFKATIAVHLSEPLIYTCAEAILGSRPSAMDSDAIDLVAELANMVAGAAKERMGREGLNLGLPTVVTGIGRQIAFQSEMQVSSVSFTSNAGPLSIEAGVKS